MLMYSPKEIVGDIYIERSDTIGQDVHAVSSVLTLGQVL